MLPLALAGCLAHAASIGPERPPVLSPTGGKGTAHRIGFAMGSKVDLRAARKQVSSGRLGPDPRTALTRRWPAAAPRGPSRRPGTRSQSLFLAGVNPRAPLIELRARCGRRPNSRVRSRDVALPDVAEPQLTAQSDADRSIPGRQTVAWAPFLGFVGACQEGSHCRPRGCGRERSAAIAVIPAGQTPVFVHFSGSFGVRHPAGLRRPREAANGRRSSRRMAGVHAWWSPSGGPLRGPHTRANSGARESRL